MPDQITKRETKREEEKKNAEGKRKRKIGRKKVQGFIQIFSVKLDGNFIDGFLSIKRPAVSVPSIVLIFLF